MYKAQIQISFTINECLTAGLSPSYEYAGKALSVINCDSVEEGIELIKKQLKKANFIIIKEESKGELRRNNSTGHSG